MATKWGEFERRKKCSYTEEERKAVRHIKSLSVKPEKIVWVKQVPMPEDENGNTEVTYVSCPYCDSLRRFSSGLHQEYRLLMVRPCPSCGKRTLPRSWFDGSVSYRRDGKSYYKAEDGTEYELVLSSRMFSTLKHVQNTPMENYIPVNVHLYEDTSRPGRYFIKQNYYQVMMDFASMKLKYVSFYMKTLFHENGRTYIVQPRRGMQKLSTYQGRAVEQYAPSSLSKPNFACTVSREYKELLLDYIDIKYGVPMGTNVLGMEIPANDYNRQLLDKAATVNKCKLLTTREFLPLVKADAVYDNCNVIFSIYGLSKTTDTDAVAYVDRYMKKLKIPKSKAILKAIYQNTELLVRFGYMSLLGFRDINLYQHEAKVRTKDTVFTADMVFKVLGEKPIGIGLRYSSGFSSPVLPYPMLFFNKAMMIRGEAAVYNDMYREFSYSDIIQAHWKLFDKGKLPLDDDFYNVSFKKLDARLSELVSIYNDTPNHVLIYSNSERSLEYEKNGYMAVPAYDTRELKTCHDKMHLCVNMYEQRCLYDDCLIYFVKKDGQYMACVEIDFKYTHPGQFTFAQVKGNCNSKLSGDVAEFVRAWAKEKGINTECDDYDFMDNDENHAPCGYGRGSYISPTREQTEEYIVKYQNVITSHPALREKMRNKVAAFCVQDEKLEKKETERWKQVKDILTDDNDYSWLDQTDDILEPSPFM